MKTMIKLMIVDDHEVVRLGLRSALELEDDMELMGDFADAKEALREAELLKPDVVLMDVRMPGMDGIEACRAMRDITPETRVIMLTSYSDQQAVFASIMAGASGYLLKNTGRADLLNAVRSVAGGVSLLDPAVTKQVLEKLKALTVKEEAREVEMLSDREREVLALVADGLTNKEIAAQLVISGNTARNHVSRILDKLGLNRRSEAAAFAAQHGLLLSDKEAED
ncbi:MAG: response regulator transcription factor [Chloroflexi bacterium]|nr:response regulator transcription factor [Chloroflexota bacterium]MDA1227209.1 response regulator transcription factor [Chloroflexota bacterium]